MAQQEDEMVLDIDETLISSSLGGMLGANGDDRLISRDEPCTIYKVRHKIRKEDPGAYDPQIISIGPFHRGNPQLLPMEFIKRQFLSKLISRHPSNSLDKYIKVVSTPAFITKIKNCYSEQVVGSNGGNAFVETMILDGCFIIEFLVKSLLGEHMGELDFVNWNRLLVEHDLLLIENQIPFYVLEVLYDSTFVPWLHDQKPPVTITALAVSFISRERESPQPTPKVIHHLLHLRHSSLRPSPDNRCKLNEKRLITKVLKKVVVNKLTRFLWLFRILSLLIDRRHPSDGRSTKWVDRAPRMLPNATELDEAGGKFVINNRATCILDVNFNVEDGIMEIPRLSVNIPSIVQLKNLVAWEQCYPQCGNHFTSYVSLIGSLAYTAEAVALLKRNGVMDSDLGSNEEVARFFNNIRRGSYLDYEHHYMKDLFGNVLEYSGTESNKWRTGVVRSFALLTVVILLLTVAQTFFALLAYFRPP